MPLSVLVSEIASELNRPNITSEQIRVKMRDALLLLEQQNSWGYMDRFVTFKLNPSAEEPRALPMPLGLKSIEFLRLVDSDGDYFRLREVSPADLTFLDTGTPTRYFKDAMQYIWLDKIPDEALTGEMSYRQYTQWSDADTFAPWPIEHFGPLIKYQTMLLLGPFVRDAELMQMYAALREQAFKAAADANYEFEFSNSDNKMIYK